MSQIATPAIRYAVLFISALTLVTSHSVMAQGGGASPEMRAVQAVEAVLRTQDAEAHRTFISEYLDTGYVATMGEAAMLEHLAEMGRAVSGSNGLDIGRTPDGVQMTFSGPTTTTISVQFASDSSGRIVSLALVSQDTSGPSREIDRRLLAVEDLGRADGDEALVAFAQEHLAPNFRASQPLDRLMQLLHDIHTSAATAGGVTVEGTPQGFRISFRGPQNADVLVQVDDQPPHLITSLKLETEIEDEERGRIDPISWDNLEARLADEEMAGFSGSVLVVHNGDVVLSRGYGPANREAGLPNTAETLFDIGSVPIDFTRAAVLKLVEMGFLELGAPIARYIANVPADKAEMTIEQLMTGRSGLPNFHHIPGVDEDYDLSYIDRDEAVRRILGLPLLFEPGTDRAHSHSAFGLLAALVEIVSEQSYKTFLATHFFEPAEMTHTGYYGDAAFAEDAYAVGYDGSVVGRINIPLYWGQTSWLVMGSGGMVSNPTDLHRFVEFVREGGLSSEMRNLFFHNGVVAGGTERGFLCMFSDAPDTSFFVCSNAHERQGDHASSVARALAQMVRG